MDKWWILFASNSVGQWSVEISGIGEDLPLEYWIGDVCCLLFWSSTSECTQFTSTRFTLYLSSAQHVIENLSTDFARKSSYSTPRKFVFTSLPTLEFLMNLKQYNNVKKNSSIVHSKLRNISPMATKVHVILRSPVVLTPSNHSNRTLYKYNLYFTFKTLKLSFYNTKVYLHPQTNQTNLCLIEMCLCTFKTTRNNPSSFQMCVCTLKAIQMRLCGPNTLKIKPSSTQMTFNTLKNAQMHSTNSHNIK